MFDAKMIGQRIKVIRGQQSQQEFADLLNIGRASLARYEVGDRTRSHVAQLFIDGQFLLGTDAQGLVQLATRFQNVRNPALNHRYRTHVA